MIKKIECYVPICDVCEKNVDDGADCVNHFDTEAEATKYALTFEYGASCEMIDGKLVCQSCWTYDDDDEIVIREAQ